ncbi:hypothetical protein [Aquiflexum sp.]|uniref:hypothetical protein n=1 Tax=Aquiflexum sp. TaxID=1872584 RepID=UPI003593CA9C
MTKKVTKKSRQWDPAPHKAFAGAAHCLPTLYPPHIKGGFRNKGITGAALKGIFGVATIGDKSLETPVLSVAKPQSSDNGVCRSSPEEPVPRIGRLNIDYLVRRGGAPGKVLRNTFRFRPTCMHRNPGYEGND